MATPIGSMALDLQVQQLTALFGANEVIQALHRSGVDMTNVTGVAMGHGPLDPAVLHPPPSQPAANNGEVQGQNPNGPRILQPEDHALPTKRALNCFMAYRSYYAPIFSSLQQKQISGFLTFLWRRDPFKSKWAVLAKAFSIIRENARVGQSPLNVFLALNTPFVGIIPPKEYLEILGWQVKVSDSGQTSLERQFVPKLSTFDKDILQTDQSVNDIIQHSYERGYINVGESLFWLSIPTVVNHNVLAVHVPILSQEEAPAIVPQIDPGMAAVEPGNNNDGMAVPAEEMAAAPVDPAAAAEEVVFAPVDHAAAAEEAMVLPVQQAVNAEEAMAVHVVQGVAAEEVLIDNTDENTNDTEPLDSEQEDNNAIPGHDLEEKFGEAEYPYNEHFHPVSAPVITLDPFEGKPFDTYDIGDWIVSEMLED